MKFHLIEQDPIRITPAKPSQKHTGSGISGQDRAASDFDMAITPSEVLNSQEIMGGPNWWRCIRIEPLQNRKRTL